MKKSHEILTWQRMKVSKKPKHLKQWMQLTVFTAFRKIEQRWGERHDKKIRRSHAFICTWIGFLSWVMLRKTVRHNILQVNLTKVMKPLAHIFLPYWWLLDKNYMGHWQCFFFTSKQIFGFFLQSRWTESTISGKLTLGIASLTSIAVKGKVAFFLSGFWTKIVNLKNGPQWKTKTRNYRTG